MIKKTVRKRRMMRAPLSSYYPMAHLCPSSSSSSYFEASWLRLVVLTLFLCSFISFIDARNTNNNHHNIQYRSRMERRASPSPALHNYQNQHQNQQQEQQQVVQPQPRYYLEQQNEYDSSSSGVSILDDDTLRLSLAIDDDHPGGGGSLSVPSLHLINPKVSFRVSGESGMIRQNEDVYHRGRDQNNEVVSSSNKRTGQDRTDLPHHHHQDEDDETEEEEEEVDENEESDMNDNYHHHYPYIESYREKYVKPDLHYVNAPPPVVIENDSKKESKPQPPPKQQVWSDIIAQVTTPSSFNEINSSASEHRLADFHFRAHIPSYYYNKYSSYSEEDLENVADLDDEHSKYFVKTRPRSVTTSGSNIYSNFYYEPPSFSTKSVPIPVKTNRKLFVFASAKPPTNNNESPQHQHQHLYVDHEEDHHEISQNNEHDDHHDEHELPQQDAPAMTTNAPTMTPPDADAADGSNYKIIQQNNASNLSLKSSAETLDVSTSQSILSKISVNSPQTKSDSKSIAGTTPRQRSNDNNGEEKSVSSSTTLTSTSTTEATTTTTDATSIPGMPGVDYPILDEIPQTGFDCKNQRYKGFFADIDAKCQAWHYCDFTDGHSTFLCPNGTLFSQVLLTCDWWFNVDCDQAKQLYVLNERLYRYIKPPKPSFPEDFTGEHVDKWLLQQLQMGLLPKVRKKSKAKLVTLPPSKSSAPSPTAHPKSEQH